MPAERQQLESGIAALEAQRVVLGDAVVVQRTHTALMTQADAIKHHSGAALRQACLANVDGIGTWLAFASRDPLTILVFVRR